MIKMLKVALYTSLLLFLIDPTTCGNKVSDTTINPISISKCEDAGYVNCSMKFTTINDDGDKALDMTLDLDETVDNEFIMTLKIDSKTSDGWDEDIFNTQGGACDFLLEHASKAWENLRKQVKPKFETECEIEPGHYELSNFEVASGDYNIATLSANGEYKVTITFTNPRDEVSVCVQLIVEVKLKDPTNL